MWEEFFLDKIINSVYFSLYARFNVIQINNWSQVVMTKSLNLKSPYEHFLDTYRQFNKKIIFNNADVVDKLVLKRMFLSQIEGYRNLKDIMILKIISLAIYIWKYFKVLI